MSNQSDLDLAQVADALRAGGHEASIEEGCILSDLDGVPFVLTFENPKLGFYCFVDKEGLSLRLTALNELNREMQFVKFALDEEDNLIVSADFILEPMDSSIQCQLERALSVWSAALDELRDFIEREARAPNRDAA